MDGADPICEHRLRACLGDVVSLAQEEGATRLVTESFQVLRVVQLSF